MSEELTKERKLELLDKESLEIFDKQEYIPCIHKDIIFRELNRKQKEIDQLRKELTKKDDEIKRLEREAGDFGTIGYMSAASDAKEALRKKDEVIEEMREALEFYANEKSWYRFIEREDIENGYHVLIIDEDVQQIRDFVYFGGKRAHDCLNKLSKE